MATDILNRLFSIVALLHSGNTCLFQKVFCTVYFDHGKENVYTMPHSAERKHAFLVKTKENTKSKKIAPRNKDALELLYHRLGHRSTRSLMAVYTANIWQYIKPRIDPNPFCTSCQITSMNKKDGSKN